MTDAPVVLILGPGPAGQDYPVFVTEPGGSGGHPLARPLVEAGATVVSATDRWVSFLASSPGLLPCPDGWPEGVRWPVDLAIVRHPHPALTAACEAAGLPVLNSTESVVCAGDKWLTHLALVRAGVPTVPTRLLPFAEGTGVSEALVRHLDGAAEGWGWPLVVKQVQGYGGVRVHLLGGLHEALAWAGNLAWSRDQQPWLVQPYVAGDDVRVVVSNGEVVAAFNRTPAPGDFRGNSHQGATYTPYDASGGVADVALAAAEAVGLRLSGVDLFVAESGILVVEVNSTPEMRPNLGVPVGRTLVPLVGR